MESAGSSREDQRRAVGDDDRVLEKACAEKSDPSAVRTTHSPSSTISPPPAAMIGSIVMTRPSVSTGDGPGSPTLKTVGSSWIRRPDAVAGQRGADREAALLDLALDGDADVVDGRAGGRDRHPALEPGLGRADQLDRRGLGLADGDRAARVGVEAVELGGDVELDQLALTQPPWARDAVDGLVADRDADRAREVVVQLRPGAGAVRGEDAGGGSVELTGRDAGADELAQLAQRLGDDLAGRSPGQRAPSGVSTDMALQARERRNVW